MEPELLADYDSLFANFHICTMMRMVKVNNESEKLLKNNSTSELDTYIK